MHPSETFALSKPDVAYTLFCGEFKYQPDVFSRLEEAGDFAPWQVHWFPGNQGNKGYTPEQRKRSQEVIHHFKNYYYDSFIHSLFPESNENNYSAYTRSYTRVLDESAEVAGVNVGIKYMDLFLFPGNIALFSLRCEFPDATLDQITFLVNEIRNFKATDIQSILNRMKDLGYDQQLILANKLKAFTVIGSGQDFSQAYNEDHLLYDLSTCSPIGASVGKGKIPELKPSGSYLNSLIENNKLSVFDNWSALALFDTFTLLHQGEVDNFQWESNYFRLLYIHSIYVQCFLVDMERKFLLEDHQENLEEEFYHFDKYFNLKKISYNFLPQVIYEKIRYGLDLDDELELIKESIERDDRKEKERRDREEAANEKRINNALVLVAFLAVFSAVFDGAEWIYNLFTSQRGVAYDFFSGTFFFLILLGILFYFRRSGP